MPRSPATGASPRSKRVSEALRFAAGNPFVRWQAVLVMGSVVLARTPTPAAGSGAWLAHGVPTALLALLLLQVVEEARRVAASPARAADGGTGTETADPASATRGDRKKADDGSEEGRFWRGLALALGVRIAVAPLAFDPALGGLRFAGSDTVAFLGLALFYVFLILAAERRLTRPATWVPPTGEQWIRWPAIAFFVLGLTHYLVLLPATLGATASAADSDGAWTKPADAAILLVVLDLFAAGHLGARAIGSRSPRWRSVFGTLGLALCLLAGSDLVRTLGPDVLAGTSGSEAMVLGSTLIWLMPYPAFSIAVALRRARFAPRQIGASPLARRRPRGGGGIMVLAALVFPTVHVVLHQIARPEASLRSHRELVVLIAVAVLGTAAFLEQRHQEARAAQLWREQREVENSLRSSEKDLRLMLERQRSSDELRRSEEKFSRTFAASPDGLAISSLETGKILEVNRSFRRIFGLETVPVAGRLGSELGLWPDQEIRRRVLSRLESRGAIRDLGVRHRTRDGRTLWLQVSFEVLQLGREPLLLTVLRDTTSLEAAAEGRGSDSGEADVRRIERSEALRWAAAPIYGEDARGRAVVWNEAAAGGPGARGGGPGEGYRVPIASAQEEAPGRIEDAAATETPAAFLVLSAVSSPDPVRAPLPPSIEPSPSGRSSSEPPSSEPAPSETLPSETTPSRESHGNETP